MNKQFAWMKAVWITHSYGYIKAFSLIACMDINKRFV